MTLQAFAGPRGRITTKFTPANIQKIKDWVAEGISREEIAKSLGVTVGSLQVTCSRLGSSLRRPQVLNGSHTRVNGARHAIPIVARKRADAQFQVTLELNGARGATALPLTDRDIAQLALAASVRNVGMTQLLTEIVITAIKKDMLKEILRKPGPDPAPQAVPESP